VLHGSLDDIGDGAQVIVLSKGVLERLQVHPETLEFLQRKQIPAHVLQTEEAMRLYNRLCEEQPAEDTVAKVVAGAESGQLRNYLDGEYRSAGKIDVLGYPSNVAEYLPGTSVIGTRPGTADGRPELVRGLDDLTMPVGTRSAPVPRGYMIPAEFGDIAAKLRAHNIKVRVLDQKMKVEGEEFVISQMRKVQRAGYEMTVLDGVFSPQQVRQFPSGTFLVDMAQPMANAAFYYLEPQARDGFVGWGVLDEKLRAIGAGRGSVRYPIFKYRREAR
jgi:hypothetical protein